MSGGVSICFIKTYGKSAFLHTTRNILVERETFYAAVHLYNQYHFEDTPREAARVQTLAASLLLRQCFSRESAV
jgi:hypothetical protein